jgi:hypothetical protein
VEIIRPLSRGKISPDRKLLAAALLQAFEFTAEAARRKVAT